MNFNEVSFEFAAGDISQLPESDLPEVVFSGKSNVGKSSLINKLVQRKALARVSATPGKTATINFFKLKEFRLVDFPGYGYAKVSKGEKRRWADLVEGYFAQERNLKLVVQILDIRHNPTQDDVGMLEYLYHYDLPFVIVLTKLDKLKKSQIQPQLDKFNELLSSYEGIDIIPFSSVTGEGKDSIQKIIEEYVLK